ncbi:MAG: hypothetical protein ACE5DX_00765 [Candidatus Dojkabacteria bacterium]
MKKKREPKSAKDILMNNDFIARIEHTNRYVSTEHQDYGLRLATNLNDLNHRALYIKLAKDVPRSKIESAASFALDYPDMKGKNKGRLFMWKLSQIAEIKLPRRKLKRKRSNQNQINLL